MSTPGDFYEFTVDAINAGTVDGMIESVTSTLNNGSISNLPDCLTYSVTYFDGVEIAANHLLAAGTTEKYKVRVEFKEDIDEDDLPDSNQTLSFAFSVNYVQANSNAALAVPLPVSFSTDSWPTIIRAVKLGNTSAYSVGDTKTIDIGTFGTHTLRIANKSTPSECFTIGFSQTACGFVLEFVDIITTHRMNPYNNTGYFNGDGTRGGWEYSDMRAFLNSIIYMNEGINYSTTGVYSALPEVLRNGIIDTTVVSGHGSLDATNFITTDKLYLLSRREVWSDVEEYTMQDQTRQLDYYATQGVDSSNCSAAIKYYDWWLRTPGIYGYGYWESVNSSGGSGHNTSTNTYGVSPAFRIG